MTARRNRLAMMGAVCVVTTGMIAPGAHAADTDDVKVSNTETVQVLMDASGKINSQRVYDQLVLTGQGKVDVVNPVSTKGLRNLDGFGGFEVRDDSVLVKTTVDGTARFRSVSDFTEKLPLKIDVAYSFDGKTVKPGDVVGKSGDLGVRYAVTNTTGVPEDVAFSDGSGNQKTSNEEVVIPMVGSLTTTLPSTFTKVQSDEANAAGDGRGGTTLSFTMTLIPPIGASSVSFGYSAHVKDGVIPKANISALPVNPLESPSFKGGAASYKGGAETGQDLTAGAAEIDANLLKIRDGAQDLVAGLILLRDGAGELSSGLNDSAAPGARKLANGAGDLDAGAAKLSAGAGDLDTGAAKIDQGAGDLSAGLGEASSKAPALIDGLEQIEAGLNALNSGLATFNGQVVPGLDQINGGASALLTALNGQLIPGLTQAEGALDTALSVVGGLADPQKTQLTQLITGAKGGVTQVKAGLSGPVTSGINGIRDGSAALKQGVNAQTSGSAAGVDGTIKNGVAKLLGGIDQILTQADPLVDGLNQLAEGANRLETGTGDLKAGTSKLEAGAGELRNGTGLLSDGADTLADGLGTAAAGSGKLAAGLNEAAGKAPDLPEGANRLSEEGTSKLIDAGDETASDYGLKYALIEAGALRAGSAQPYGSPRGATALTAYKFELASAEGAESSNLKRGLGALVILAACMALAALRRSRA